ncbi:MAG: M20/M25/M40 family metallo-hydrolase [Oscillospiraceae bacterium]
MVALYVLLCILAVVVLLLLAAALRTLFIKNRLPKKQAPAVNKELAAKYAEALGALLQCDTVNDAGLAPEEAARKFARFRAVLAQRFPLVHSRLEQVLLGDALLYRWKGADSTKEAVVLMAHSDVVPATGSWQHPPFGGEIADDRIWGRGAMDNKGSLCAILQAAEGLLAEGFVPPCDIYLSSSNNEETMGDGAPKIVEYLKSQQVKLALAIDEGGAVVEAPLPGLKGLYAMVGIVEKGYANVKFTAKSTGGHASTPPANTPLARLAAFVTEVEKHPPFARKFSPPVRQMFEALAPSMNFPLRLVCGNLWLFEPLLCALLPKVSAQAAALLRTTCAFTMAQGSSAANVIPEEASVTANLRFIMHQPMAESLAAITAVAEKYHLSTEVLYAHDCSPFVDTQSETFAYLLQCVQENFPEAGVAPYIMLGGTDARHFATYCPCTIRFAPTILTGQQLASMHGLDENLGVDALARAVGFYTYVLRNFAPKQ